MDRHHVRGGEQFVLAHRAHAQGVCPFRVEVLAPRHDVHAERRTDPSDLRSQTSQTDHAEAVPVEVSTDRRLPAAASDSGVLGRDAAQDRKDESPGQLRCRRGGRLGSADHDPLRSRRLHVDGGVDPPRGHEQTQVRQPFQPTGGEGGSLTHRHNHLGAVEDLHQVIVVDDGARDELDLGIEAAPVRELPCHLLIVIENDDAHAPPRLL